MKKYLFLLFFCCLATAVYATPPSDMGLTYNAGTLDVKMRHVSRELREHYIHIIKVSVNDAEPKIFYYPFQRYPSEFEALIPITLNPGDRIVVQAQCIQGGNARAELTIPVIDENSADAAMPSSEQGAPAQPVNTTPSQYGR